ncbi:MAG: ABC-type transport auxiliary lipoprotein family protein [Beijerinckiaceae bacterium]|nr:ABC-type transport auxiliary lipoprotein family protein [Beijerinckiaceae bacterium]
METNARYLAVGSLALTVILAAFAFVYWLDNSGGLASRVPYRLQFFHNVSGLQPGAAVLFDGVRVGEVTGLIIDPHDPEHVVASIAVNEGTPLRKDTKVDIESQGLTGTAAVLLEGGSPSAPPLVGKDGAPPLIVAGPDVGRSLTQTARQALQRVDKILSDNADSFKATMDNLKSFTDALARNSDKVDAVIAGLERMTSGETAKPPPVYDLNVPKLSGLPDTRLPGQIFISDPTAVVALQTQRLLSRSPDGQLVIVGTMQWSDTLPKLFQEKILQSFEDAGISASLGPPDDHAKTDREIKIDLRSFNVTGPVDSNAEIGFAATLLSGDGHVLKTHVFKTSIPCSSRDELVMVKALNTAFGNAANDLAVWASEAL